MIIIGGGPAGTITGIELLKKGEEVTLFDRLGQQVNKNIRCSGILSQKAHAFYSNYINLPIVNKLSTAVVWFGHKSLTITPDTSAFIISREHLNLSLMHKFVSLGGKVIQKNVDKTFLKNINEDVIVGADGPCSVVANSFGFPKFSKVFVTAQFFTTKNITIPKNEAHIFLGYKDSIFGWLFPKGPCYEIGMASQNNIYKNITHLAERLNQPLIKKIYHIIPYGPRDIFAKTVANKKIYLVGDAAGHVKPTTGGGLYHSGLSAKLLAECISHNVSPEQYQTKWRQIQQNNFSKMKKINRFINLLPPALYPFVCDALKLLKIDLFLASCGDMESTDFVSAKRFIEFVLQ